MRNPAGAGSGCFGSPTMDAARFALFGIVKGGGALHGLAGLEHRDVTDVPTKSSSSEMSNRSPRRRS